MGIEYREELVGKRFLCVTGNKLKTSQVSKWPWRAGIIRAVDKSSPADGKEAIVYVEFDGQAWEKREWLKVNDESHKAFLVEKAIVWAERIDPYSGNPVSIWWPALNYKILVDKVGLKDSHSKPVEFLLDNLLDFFKKEETRPFKEDNKRTLNRPIFKRYPEVKVEVDKWLHEQKEQHIFMKAPYCLSGYRVQVYRIGSTTQWFTAVITGHDLLTRDLVVMDDTVLESHTENPAHVHMMFLDDVVNSLLKGENVGITPRRRMNTHSNAQTSTMATYTRTLPTAHPAPTSANNQIVQPQTKKKRTKAMETNPELEKEVTKPGEKITKEKEKNGNTKPRKERKRKTDVNTANVDGKKSPALIKRSRSNSLSSESSQEKEMDTIEGSKASTLTTSGPPSVNSRVPLVPEHTRSPQGVSSPLPPKSSSPYVMNSVSPSPRMQSRSLKSSRKSPQVVEEGRKIPEQNPRVVELMQKPLEGVSPFSTGCVNNLEVGSRLQEGLIHLSERTSKKAESGEESVKTDTAPEHCPTVVNVPVSKQEVIPRKDDKDLPEGKKDGIKPSGSPRQNSSDVKKEPEKQKPKQRSGFRGIPKSAFQSAYGLISLSQAVALESSGKVPCNDKETPFTSAIAGIIARELSKGNEAKPPSSNPSTNNESKAVNPAEKNKVSVTLSASTKSISQPVFTTTSTSVVTTSIPHSSPLPQATSSVIQKPSPKNSISVISKVGGTLREESLQRLSSERVEHLPREHSSGETGRSHLDKHSLREAERLSHNFIRESEKNMKAAHEKLKFLAESKDRDLLSQWGRDRREKDYLERHKSDSSESYSSRDSGIGLNVAVSGYCPVEVYRDPNLLDNSVTHIESIQHHLYQLKQKERHSPSPAARHTPHGPSPLSVLRSAAAPGGPLSGSPSAFVPSHLQTHPGLPHHALFPHPLQVYQHQIAQGLGYPGSIHAAGVDQQHYHQQHLAELIHHQQDVLTRLQHPLGLATLVAGQQGTPILSSLPPGLSPAQLQALWQQHHPGIPLPTGFLIPHHQEELEIAHLQAQREKQKLQVEKVQSALQGAHHSQLAPHAKMETKAMLQADKHLFQKSASPHVSQHHRLTPQTTSSGTPPHHNLTHPDVVGYRPDSRHRHPDLPLSEVHAAIERHFQESLGKPHAPYSAFTTAAGSITRGTPLPKTDPRNAPSGRDMQHKEQLEQERLRREREEKEREWQQLQREKEYKQNQIQRDLEARIMYPGGSIERDKHPKTSKASERKPSDDPLYQHMMNQLNSVQAAGLFESYGDRKPGGPELLTSHGPKSKSQNGHGSQIFQPYKPSATRSLYGPTSGLKLEEPRPGVLVRTEHNRLTTSSSSAFQVKSKHLEGYQPFRHTVSHNSMDKSQGTKHLEGLEVGLRKTMPTPPPLIKKEPDHNKSGHDTPRIRTETAKSLWERQIEIQLAQQLGKPMIKSEPSHSVPVIVSRASGGPPPLQSSSQASPLKVASPQQLSAAALQPMDIKPGISTSSLSSICTSTSTTAALVSQASILMSALRPENTKHLKEEKKQTAISEKPGKRKSPHQHPSHKKRQRDNLEQIAKDNFRKVGEMTSFSDHCQSLLAESQAPLISGSAMPAKVSENIELKIEKVDQYKRAMDLSGMATLAQVATNNAHNALKNGSFSDSERSRSVSPRSSSDSSDSRSIKTASPNRSGGPMKAKKAWLQRLSGNTEAAIQATIKTEPKENPLSSSLPNGHLHSDNSSSLTSTPVISDSKPIVTLSDVQKNIPGYIYDFDNSSTCSESSTTPSSPKSRSRRSKEGSKRGSRKRTGSPMTGRTNQSKPEQTLNPINGVEKRSVMIDTFSHHKQVTASLVDLMSKVSKNQVFTRSRKDREAFNLQRSLNKPPISKLKRSGEPFLQDGSCCEITPNLMKCRECRVKSNKQSKQNIFCRFYAFRRLRYSTKGNLTIAGFSEIEHYDQDDLAPWLPYLPDDITAMDVEVSKYIIMMTGDMFCNLVIQEQKAKAMNMDTEGKMAWKRPVSGVREMCDTCDTTLFNIHWTCQKCGFVVCLDCYKAKKSFIKGDKFKAGLNWLKCIKDQAHNPESLMLTQIIPGSAMLDVGTLVHEICKRWQLPASCPCLKMAENPSVNGVTTVHMAGDAPCLKSEDKSNMRVISEEKQVEISPPVKAKPVNNVPISNTSALDFLADIATSTHSPSITNSETTVKISPEQEKTQKLAFHPQLSPSTTDIVLSSKGENCSTLRELLTKTAGKLGKPAGPLDGGSFLSAFILPKCEQSPKTKSRIMSSTFEDIIATVVEQNIASSPSLSKLERLSQKTMCSERNTISRNPSLKDATKPCKVMTTGSLTESGLLYPDVPHSLICNGEIMRLHDPAHKGNFKIFQEQWGRGNPVIVSNVHKNLSQHLWHPKYFNKKFGSLENDLVDCRKSSIIQGAPMKDFWEGFEDLSNRLETKSGLPMILKLKDWPPAEDFSEILPEHFKDLMDNLPLPEYTRRDGVLNLSSRLPDFFVKPDLGPKMYNAYGLARYPTAGTTNLHLDISDAVNVMVYVGIPIGGRKLADQARALQEEAVQAVEQSCPDEATIKRVREGEEKPGALWHIFKAEDTEKIRQFLCKVLTEEHGEKVPADHDPIHDQSLYINDEMLKRLQDDYGVRVWAITQCLGDSIFIPAGAPHQVRNLHSCIKVAEDFVSPEHLSECCWLTQEFRHLSKTHSNHEDKLQIKSILYHAIKDAVGVLMSQDPKASADVKPEEIKEN